MRIIQFLRNLNGFFSKIVFLTLLKTDFFSHIPDLLTTTRMTAQTRQSAIVLNETPELSEKPTSEFNNSTAAHFLTVPQDLSFKLHSGTTQWGKFSMFGILASSSISIAGGNTGSLYGSKDGNDLGSKIRIIGVNHFKQLTKNAYLSSTIGLNYSSTDQVNYATDRTTDE